MYWTLSTAMQSDGGGVWQPEVAVPPGQKKPPRTTSLGEKRGGGWGKSGVDLHHSLCNLEIARDCNLKRTLSGGGDGPQKTIKLDQKISRPYLPKYPRAYPVKQEPWRRSIQRWTAHGPGSRASTPTRAFRMFVCLKKRSPGSNLLRVLSSVHPEMHIPFSSTVCCCRLSAHGSRCTANTSKKWFQES